MGVVKALSSMRKAEILAEMDQYGLEYSQKDTIPELIPRLAAERKKRGVKTMGQVKIEEKSTDPKVGISGLSKTELHQRTEELGITVTDGMTRNQMISAIKGHLLATEIAQDEDKVEFGKHASLTYAELRDNQPDYANWVIKTIESWSEDEAPYPRMVRLYRYLVTHPKTVPKSELKKEKDGTKVPVPESPRFTDMEERLIQEAMRRIQAGGQSSSASSAKGDEQRMTDQTKRAPPKGKPDSEEPSMDLLGPVTVGTARAPPLRLS
jgi:hypothetical protein